MRRRLITPAAAPITLSEARSNLRVDHDQDDALIQRLINAAAARVEKEADRAFGAQTWEVILDAFPDDDIEIPWGPLVSVTSITYLDADLEEQTLDAELYGFEEGHPLGLIVTLDTWPTAGTSRNAVVVRYVAGDGWPEDIKQAVHLLVGHWYRNRETAGELMHDLPFGACALIGLHRRMYA